MSIASEITRLQNIKADIRSALVTQGVPAASGHDMADFSADILSISTGGGATITVTYSSQFYNKTMTCTKGTKTYTKTTTSSGSTVFDVDESGTWTITCDGTSRTVDVVLEYTTQMAITKTITVYSAASDTVSFTDMTGAKTVTTDSSGEGSVDITFIPPSANITFTSSVAKNPDDLSQAYSKSIMLTVNTTSIYVMPDNTLYWWGYNNGIEAVNATNGWSMPSGYSVQAPTFNTQSISVNATSGQCVSGIGSTNKFNMTKAYCIGNQTRKDNVYSYLGFGGVSNKTHSIGNAWDVSASPLKYTVSNLSGETYLEVGAYYTSTGNVYAIWYE